MGLPDVNAENITGGHDHTRPELVELDPVDLASGYHGADLPIRSPTARASCRSGRSPAASAASAKSCWAKESVDRAEWRRSWSVTHLEKGMSRLSIMGITSSGTLIVLFGMYVCYIHTHHVQGRLSDRRGSTPPPGQRAAPSIHKAGIAIDEVLLGHDAGTVEQPELANVEFVQIDLESDLDHPVGPDAVRCGAGDQSDRASWVTSLRSGESPSYS